jgi:hypothetical protein
MRTAELGQENAGNAEGGRGWSWAALLAALVLWVSALPTWGLSVLLAPLSLLLLVVAWFRAPRDAVFWIGLALNAVLALGLIGFIVDLLTGEITVS